LDKILRDKKFHLKARLLSNNKIFISNGIYKHTNDKVIITLYIYNRQKINYLYFIKRIFKHTINKNLYLEIPKIKEELNDLKKFKLNYLKNINLIINTLDKSNKFNNIYINYLYKHKKHKVNLYKKIKLNLMKKYKLFFYYKQQMFINKSKLNHNYLSYLNFLLKKIFNKKIQFNLINLKSYTMNSDIFLESFVLKIRKKKRKKAINLYKLFKMLKEKTRINNFKKIVRSNEKKINVLETLVKAEKLDIKHTVINLLKYKKIVGFKLQLKGKLTTRISSSRSSIKIKEKGNLSDIDSSLKKISSVNLRGYLKPNMQKSKLNSKSDLGTFGYKG
jgi:hypothetical protein